ncbi:MAG: BspA family leucine-rich repeat surface protein [Saprospiraceae bacterium]
MFNMFRAATSFNQDLSGWNVSNVTNMGGMFSAATSFNQNISGWNVSSVTNMWEMFNNANAFNQDIGNWMIANVIHMTDMLSTHGLSQTNYDNTLIGWAAQTVQNNVLLGANGLTYCLGGNGAIH